MAGRVTVVGEGVERRLGHRVDGVGDDELIDVEDVRVRGVLGARTRPQWALGLRAGGRSQTITSNGFPRFA